MNYYGHGGDDHHGYGHAEGSERYERGRGASAAASATASPTRPPTHAAAGRNLRAVAADASTSSSNIQAGRRRVYYQ